MCKVILFILLLSNLSLFSQELLFDFEESELNGWEESSYGHWQIDTLNAMNGKGSLHHNFDTTASSSDIISYRHEQVCLDSSITEWQFSVRYDYSPSSGNNWAVWLTSTMGAKEMQASGSSSGYVLGVNYTSSDDLVKIWRQDGGNKTVILSTPFNWQESIAIGKVVRFKITRSIKKEWELLIDTTSGEFLSIGSCIDSSYLKSEYFGIYYKYTFTQDMKLWIDDFYLKGTFYIDREPPFVNSFKLEERNEIALYFNEGIDTTQAITFLLNTKYQPISIRWNSITSVKLQFETNFEQDNLLEFSSLTDLNGNSGLAESMSFQYYKPELYDVLLSEIMPDPYPPVELPECEYVELYNRSEKPLNLKGWEFISGQRTPIVFNEYILDPERYVLLVDNGCYSEFPDSIQKISFTSLPTLPNAGETLILKDKYGQLIHKISYKSNWYSDALKAEGGWSLELIDSDFPCVFTNNWKESSSETGGTPGYRNSVSGELDNYPVSTLTSISEITETSCKLKFTQALDSLSASETTNYWFIDSDVQISSATPISPSFTEVMLYFSKSLSSGEIYTLAIGNYLHDCSGIILSDESMPFGVPQIADSANILINEILYEANDDIPEFIELYNISEKVIDLKNFSVASIDEYSDTIKALKIVAAENFLLFPKNYVVLTENKQLLADKFHYLSAENILEPTSWLTLTNTGGKIGLLDEKGHLIDAAIYSPAMHFSLLENTSGISLERISVLQSGTDFYNWHSAATNFDYASPGIENSQSYQDENGISLVSASPKEFSPDNDGLNDFVSIHYNFPKPGFIANIKIFSQKGLPVRQFVNNDLCGISGNYIWDGLDNFGNRLAMGYYIIYFEAWHSTGEVIKEKLVVLLLPEKK
jgi:hypothetical protein